MLLNIYLGVSVFVGLFLAYVATREGRFRYERSELIHASPEQIFPYISSFQKGNEWSPYMKKDPNMKIAITEPDGIIGSAMTFNGNSEVGAGKLELLKVVPNESVEMKLTMLKPFKAVNLVGYVLTPEGTGTRFTWVMSGDGGFLGKFINVMVDCEALATKDWAVGFENLKKIVEQTK